MSRFKITFLTGFILLLTFGTFVSECKAYPSQFSEEQVRSAVETWVRYVTADARTDASVTRMQPYEEGGRVVGYIAHLSGGGFCLAGANELLLPIYLYVPAGEYDPNDPDIVYFLWEMGERLRLIEQLQILNASEMEAYQSALQERADLWRDLINGEIPVVSQMYAVSAAPSQMVLPLTTQWGQGSPYNDQCPNLTPGQDERAVTGCVATAIAQIMNYWKWPVSGVGSGSVNYNWRFRTNWDEQPLATNPNIPTVWGNRLVWTAANGGRLQMSGYWDGSVYNSARAISADSSYRSALETLYNRLTPGSTTVSANYGATTYNWNLLQNTHTDPVDPGDVEVARLMMHVGVAHNMNYGIHGSGTDWSESALENNFRYDTDVFVQRPPNANDIIAEIQWLRPVPFGGYAATGGGHAWVVLGYNLSTSPVQFRMNLGWNGGSDGWYSFDTVPSGFTVNQDCMLRMAPQGVVRFVGNTGSGDGSPSSPYQNIEQAVANVPDGATLIFKAGSTNTFSTPSLTISKPLTLKGKGITIQKP
jgi:hypothetical protein